MTSFYIRDRDKRIGIIPSYDNIQWTRCAQDYGRFSMVMKTDAFERQAQLIKKWNRLEKSDDNDHMVIEDIREVDGAEGMISCSGRSLLSRLNQNIVWVTPQAPPLMTGDIAGLIGTLLERHAINPADPLRRLPVIYEPCDGLPKETLRRSVSWTPLGDAVIKKIKERGLGIRSFYRDGSIVVQPYPIIKNPIVFSRRRGIIDSLERFITAREYANFAIVAGEGEYPGRVVVSVGSDASGLDRFEKYVDASDLSSEGYGDNYADALVQAGREALQSAALCDEFSAKMDRSSLVYKQHYDVGQIVTVQSRFGYAVNLLISEVTETYDGDGVAYDPVFTPPPLTTDEEG